MQGLGRPGKGLMVAAGTYGLAGLFASSLLKEVNAASTIDSRGTALVTRRNISYVLVHV